MEDHQRGIQDFEKDVQTALIDLLHGVYTMITLLVISPTEQATLLHSHLFVNGNHNHNQRVNIRFNGIIIIPYTIKRHHIHLIRNALRVGDILSSSS